MIYIGIDPGLSGGICFLGDEHTSVDGDKGIKVMATPTIGSREYDIQEMKNILLRETISCTIGIAILETQIAMPGQGLTSTLTTGKGFGIWLGLLAGLDIPYQVVGARQWQVKLFTGVSAKLNTKEKSEVIAKRLFPQADFRKSERARKAHDGLTDATCIAEYGRRIHSKDAPVKKTGVPHLANPENPEICTQCGGYIPSLEENDCPQLKLT